MSTITRPIPKPVDPVAHRIGKPITKEEFENLPDAFKRFEVVDGLLREVDDWNEKKVFAVGDPITIEEFENLSFVFGSYEVIDGVLTESTNMGNRESVIASLLIIELGKHLGDARAARQIFSSEARFRLPHDTSKVRGCDVSFVPADRLPSGYAESGVGDYVPALAVEVVSKGNRAVEHERKIADWLRAGVDLIWVIFPEIGAAHSLTATSMQMIELDGVLDGGVVLPGLQIPLAALIHPPKTP